MAYLHDIFDAMQMRIRKLNIALLSFALCEFCEGKAHIEAYQLDIHHGMGKMMIWVAHYVSVHAD